jgi:hypothetical protein
MQPFVELATTFAETLDAQVDELWDEQVMMRNVVEIVYDSFREHRNGVLAIASMQSFDGVGFEEVQALVNNAFGDVVELSAEHNSRRGWPAQKDLELSIRMVIGMVASMAVLEPLFVPQGRRRPSRSQLIDHLTAVALHGVRAETG